MLVAHLSSIEKGRVTFLKLDEGHCFVEALLDKRVALMVLLEQHVKVVDWQAQHVSEALH